MFCNWEKEIRITEPESELACLHTRASVACSSVSNWTRACFSHSSQRPCCLQWFHAPLQGSQYPLHWCLVGVWTNGSSSSGSSNTCSFLAALRLKRLRFEWTYSCVSAPCVMFACFEKLTSNRFPNNMAPCISVKMF